MMDCCFCNELDRLRRAALYVMFVISDSKSRLKNRNITVQRTTGTYCANRLKQPLAPTKPLTIRIMQPPSRAWAGGLLRLLSAPQEALYYGKFTIARE